ncbi:MBL fold metallo-hydrolase [Micrococcus sp.]|uniref:MBL fold metallo-hydrolase n=1 Tax=Micrococcus sp. TaxID=1271 RepID=UPI002A909140|nr:MBL fold metallo-hydrolase [Micrococcus sp.]MDY6054456.1 MBL fold metallo-hydrolase [Micrococcus sp.]
MSDAAPRLLHDLPAVTVRAVSVSEMDNNVYLITSKTTGTQVLVDAADEPDTLHALLDSAAADTPCRTRLELIVTTHRHWDHIRALPALAEGTGASTAAGAQDAAAIAEDTGVAPDLRLRHGDTVGADGIELEVIALRGHTPGSVALAYRPEADEPTVLFTGDSLFPGGVGKTDSDDDFRSLLADVTERLFDVYEDDTLVHPGHGDSTTLGAERPHLDDWAARGW